MVNIILMDVPRFLWIVYWLGPPVPLEIPV